MFNQRARKGKSTTGLETRKVGTVSTSIRHMVSSPPRKKICLPPSPHCGSLPPLDEICNLGAGPGKGCAYSSFRPDPSLAHTIHFPSGENIAPVSLNCV